MAHIAKETILVEVSKLFKNNEESAILDDSQRAVIRDVIETSIAEILGDASLVIEVINTDENDN